MCVVLLQSSCTKRKIVQEYKLCNYIATKLWLSSMFDAIRTSYITMLSHTHTLWQLLRLLPYCPTVRRDSPAREAKHIRKRRLLTWRTGVSTVTVERHTCGFLDNFLLTQLHCCTAHVGEQRTAAKRTQPDCTWLPMLCNASERSCCPLLFW